MPSDPFYQSRQWVALRSKVRTKWLRDGKPCGMCKKPFGMRDKMIVDHIVPRKDAPHLALDERNLQLMHWGCHNIKTHKHERLNLPQIGLDGMPEDSDWS